MYGTRMYVGKGRVIKFVSFQLHVYKLIYYMYLSCTKYRLDTEVEVSQENRYGAKGGIY